MSYSHSVMSHYHLSPPIGESLRWHVGVTLSFTQIFIDDLKCNNQPQKAKSVALVYSLSPQTLAIYQIIVTIKTYHKTKTYFE